MSEHQERQSARDKLYQRTQELASSSQKFATIGVQALGAGINDIKANSKVQEGASSVTSSVRKIGERLNEIKANPKVQEGASTVSSSVRKLGGHWNDIKANPKVQEGATNVKSSVRKLGIRLKELKDSERVRMANKGVKSIGDRLQKINLPRLIAEMEKDQNIADNLERINNDLMEEKKFLEMIRDAEEACMQAITEHFLEFVADKPNVTYEQWIADLHPENTHEGRLLEGMDKEVDHRFYVEGSDHRILWNNHLANGRTYVTARTMGWGNGDDVNHFDFFSTNNFESTDKDQVEFSIPTINFDVVPIEVTHEENEDLRLDSELYIDPSKVMKQVERIPYDAILNHFVEFVADTPDVTYEKWICNLHPEASHKGKLLNRMNMENCFYGDNSDHRKIWNAHLGGGRMYVSAKTIPWKHTNNGSVQIGDLNAKKSYGENMRDNNWKEGHGDALRSDLDDENETREMMKHAEEVCYNTIMDHFVEFVANTPNVTYEQWICDLHPENAHEGLLLAGMDKEVDHRFYVEDSDHRKLWNAHLGSGRTFVPARTKAWSGVNNFAGQIDLLNTANPGYEKPREERRNEGNEDDLISFDNLEKVSN